MIKKNKQTYEEIYRCYSLDKQSLTRKQLMMKYHPDRWVEYPEYEKYLTKIFQEINNLTDTILEDIQSNPEHQNQSVDKYKRPYDDYIAKVNKGIEEELQRQINNRLIIIITGYIDTIIITDIILKKDVNDTIIKVGEARRIRTEGYSFKRDDPFQFFLNDTVYS